MNLQQLGPTIWAEFNEYGFIIRFWVADKGYADPTIPVEPVRMFI